jgi:hypothetical protein
MSEPKGNVAFIEPMLLQRTETLPEGDAWLYEILCGPPHNAEDFKQGAMFKKPQMRTSSMAPCLKFRCAKPPEDTLEVYVF